MHNALNLLINTPTAVGHLQGALMFYVMCSLWVNICGRYSTYMCEIIVMKIKYQNS